MLHVYLRLPIIKEYLSEQWITKKEINLNSQADEHLMNIIKEAYKNCDKKFDDIPIIDVDPFREELSNECSSNFPLNKPGDPQKFLKY